jgi:hypothetical protein
MMRLVISLALVVCSCARGAGGPAAQAVGTGPVNAPGPKKLALSWGIEQHGPSADVFLATTDETGKQVSHPLGTYRGVCSVITPAAEMNAVTGVGCRDGARGTELHAVIQNGEDVVILKLGVDEGVKQDPMAREEVTRVKAPPGAKVQVGA